MASLNRVVLVGNLTRDPELRTTPNGTSVATLGIAVNRRWTNSQGEKVDNTDFFNVVAWGKLAELCSEYTSKGSPVAVDGRLQSRSWETQDGQKRQTVEVVAENVQFLSRAPERGTGYQAQDRAPSQPKPPEQPIDKAPSDEAEIIDVDQSNDDVPF